MINTNELGDLLEEIGEINEAIFPLHLIIGALAVVLALWCYIRPNNLNNKLMKIFLAFYYGIIVFTCIKCALNIPNIYYYLTVVVHMLICFLFVLTIFNDEIRFSLPDKNMFKVLSISMSLYGIFLYPLVELILGYNWPKIFVLSFCPMTIFAIGIVITAYPKSVDFKINQILLLLLSFGAVIFGTRTVLIGGIFDLSYLISGIIGFSILLKYNLKLNFPRGRNRSRSGDLNEYQHST